MAKLDILHHELVGTSPHRWHVHLRDRDEPVHVELPEEERGRLDLSDEEINDLLPVAFERAHGSHSDEETWDAPVRVYQTHFMG
jgi:hypothetical protein